MKDTSVILMRHEPARRRPALPLSRRSRLLVAAVLLQSVFPVVTRAAAPPVDPEALARLARDSGGTSEVALHPATGAARFVRWRAERLSLAGRAATPAEQSARFLRRYARIFGIEDPERELVLKRSARDGYGLHHVEYLQVRRGVPVFAGELRAHTDREGRLVALNGVLVPEIRISEVPSLSAAQAAEVAVELVARQQGVATDDPRLGVTASDLFFFREGLLKGVEGPTRLVYRVEVRSVALGIGEWLFVDAHSGKLVDQITRVLDALDRKVYEGSLESVPSWEDSAMDPDPIPFGWDGGTVQQVNDWQDEIDGAREMYNLISSLTGGQFLSFDSASGTMLTVNEPEDLKCPNASWDGVTTKFCSGTATDDVVGHEWSHGYTDFTSNLIYQWQSGALNESFADIWGEVLDLLNGRGLDEPSAVRDAENCSSHPSGANVPGFSTVDTIRWLIAEGSSAFGTAIRDLWEPRCFGSPGKVSDLEYRCEGDDNGGVHSNSGVPNRLFALLVDGGTVDATTIQPIGLTRAAHVHWLAQTLLTPASSFADHADALALACASLIGMDLPSLSTTSPVTGSSGESISAADCDQVAAVTLAVELADEPTHCGFRPLLDPEAPPLCEGTVETIYATDWELGLGSWSAATRGVTNPPTFDTPDWSVVGSLPDSRPGQAAFVADDLTLGNCVEDVESGILYLESPLITVGEEQLPRLAFDHFVATEAGFDGGNLEIDAGSGFVPVPGSAFVFNPYNLVLEVFQNDNPKAGEQAFSGANGGVLTGSWGQSQVDLSSLVPSGESFRLRFEMGLDGCNGLLGWYVDDVQVFACSPCGNLRLDGDETCDDGNGQGGDGCSSSCQVEAGWTCTEPLPPTPGENIVADPGFELGSPNPSWVESSTQGTLPICDATSCGVDGAQTGDHWAWFGRSNLGEDAAVSQDVLIPEAATTLRFAFSVPFCGSAHGDVFRVLIDGVTLFETASESSLCNVSSYSEQSVDVSTFADGGIHELELFAQVLNNGRDTTSFYVDDLVLDDGSGDPPVPSTCVELIFIDGFESGSTSAWSATEGAAP